MTELEFSTQIKLKDSVEFTFYHAYCRPFMRAVMMFGLFWLCIRSKVINMYGGKPTSIQLLKRNFARCIPFEFITFLTPGKGLHDAVSKTRVIKIVRTT